MLMQDCNFKAGRIRGNDISRVAVSQQRAPWFYIIRGFSKL